MTILSTEPIGDDARIPNAALLLGWAGVLPFAAGAVTVLVRGTGEPWILVPFLAYGAIILSFLGGVRWGFACRMVNSDIQARQLAASVLPSLVGWAGVSMAAHPASGLLLLTLAHVAQGVWDVRDARSGLLPAWYGRLRVQLASAAVLTLAAGGLALALR